MIRSKNHNKGKMYLASKTEARKENHITTLRIRERYKILEDSLYAEISYWKRGREVSLQGLIEKMSTLHFYVLDVLLILNI